MGNKRAEDEITGINDSSQESAKRCKSETKDENVDETNQPTKLRIDLHDDYLELIFRWLNLNDLMTMMKVEERFHQSIERTFFKKYGKKFTVTMCSRNMNTNALVFRELSKIKPFFQCFGASIEKLTVIFDENKSDQCMAIEQSIVEYCVKLKELNLTLCRKGAFDDIAKPFDTLEVLRFRSGYLGDTLSQLGKWFPNLQTLKMDDVTFPDQICINGTIPFLQRLDINMGVRPKKISPKNMDGAIGFNSQLRSIRLKCGKYRRYLR